MLRTRAAWSIPPPGRARTVERSPRRTVVRAGAPGDARLECVMPQESHDISRVSAVPAGDGSRVATSGAERLALGSRRALDMYLLYESAVERHMALFDRVCAAR